MSEGLCITARPVERLKGQSSLVRRLVQAQNDPAKQRIRVLLKDLDDEKLSGIGLNPEDIVVRGGTMEWRIVMHTVEARLGGQRLLSCEPLIRWTVALGRLGAIFANIFGGDSRQDDVVPGYEGYGWCDSSERQILDQATR
jgi:hypothetical protein